jgi:hypothetical protein
MNFNENRKQLKFITMKTKIGILVLALCTSFINLQAQITTRAKSFDISDNLDLKAVSTIFGESRDLEDFEQRLNDPDAQISNLDLNQDGYVDYLRVAETTENGVSEIVLQAVLGDNVFQDVATIDVQKNPNGNPNVQVIGDPYLYGPDYVFEPVYVGTPIIFGFFWGPAYRPWHSPYYWGHFPPRFHYWSPFATFRYQRNVRVYVNIGNTYNFTVERRIIKPSGFHNELRRNDYADRHPEMSFNHRHEGIKNKIELNHSRPSNIVNEGRRMNYYAPTQRQRPVSVGNQQERRAVEKSPSAPVPQTRQAPENVQPANRVEPTKENPVSTKKAEIKQTRNRIYNKQVKANRRAAKMKRNNP